MRQIWDKHWLFQNCEQREWRWKWEKLRRENRMWNEDTTMQENEKGRWRDKNVASTSVKRAGKLRKWQTQENSIAWICLHLFVALHSTCTPTHPYIGRDILTCGPTSINYRVLPLISYSCWVHWGSCLRCAFCALLLHVSNPHKLHCFGPVSATHIKFHTARLTKKEQQPYCNKEI